MNRFIGLFDSGMGGLTVLNQIISALPAENTVYFGDMGRAPYGSKSTEVLNRYSEQIVRYLLDNYDLKLIVAACDTISATSLKHLKRTFDFPIMGIIDPVPDKAIEATRNGRIGIIGTRRTIESGVYQEKILGLNAGIKVFSQECPLLMHLVEEGWANEPATRMIIGEYLANLRHSRIDTLIMGCTHYPILRGTIQEYLGSGVTIIDPAVECLAAVKEFLLEKEKLNKDNYPERIYLVTDNPGLFRSSGERYLDRKIHNVNMVDIGLLEKYDLKHGAGESGS
ncbi:MAG: glutamate racemase [Thermodesulfobacteriota bacterium]